MQETPRSYLGSTMQLFTSVLVNVVACILLTIAIGILATAEGLTRIFFLLGAVVDKTYRRI